MGSILGGAPQPAPVQMPTFTPPEPAKVEPPVVMPIKDDVADKQAQQREIARLRGKRTTRSNTIIGGDDDDMGA